GTLTITQAPTTSKVTVTPNSQQYSDNVTFTATLTPDQIIGVAPASSVTFKVGSQVMGTVSLNPSAGSLTASLGPVALLEPSPFGAAPTGQMAPGGHTVTAEFGGVNPNFTVTTASTGLSINAEDAAATYTGALFASTSSATSSTATVTLSATIQDITAVNGDPNPGDVRNAKVTFINRDTNTVIVSNVLVGLVNASDTTTGTATYNWSTSIACASPPCSQTYTIGIIVTNYYTRNSSNDDTVITVAQPGTNFITGGGY